MQTSINHCAACSAVSCPDGSSGSRSCLSDNNSEDDREPAARMTYAIGQSIRPRIDNRLKGKIVFVYNQIGDATPPQEFAKQQHLIHTTFSMERTWVRRRALFKWYNRTAMHSFRGNDKVSYVNRVLYRWSCAPRNLSWNTYPPIYAKRNT